MPAQMGQDGGFAVGSTLVTFFDNWTLNASVDIVETTAYGDTHKARIQTLKDWTVDCGGTLDRSDAQQAALLDQLEDGTLAAVAVRMETLRGSKYWYGSVLISGWSIAHALADRVAVTFNLVGTGALSYAG